MRVDGGSGTERDTLTRRPTDPSRLGCILNLPGTIMILTSTMLTSGERLPVQFLVVPLLFQCLSERKCLMPESSN